MNRLRLNNNTPLFICAVIAAAILFTTLGFKVFAVRMTDYNDKKATEYIEKDLQYIDSNEDDEKTKLVELSEERYMSPEVRGHVYERLSLFYSVDETPVLYFDTLGKAQYYLEKGNDLDTLANIYADLANYYYTHSEIGLAQDSLDQLYSITDVEYLNSFQQKSYICRLQGIFDTKNGNYTEAEDQLLKSIEYVNNDPGEAFYGLSYIAISEVALANLYYQTGEYDKCRELVDKYADSEFFTQEIYADILARDFSIPYYTVAIDINIHDGNIPPVEPLILKFMDACEYFGYRNIELEQLVFLKENMPADNPEFNKKTSDTISECYKYINEDLYHRQAIFADSQIEFSKQNIVDRENAEKTSQKEIINILIFIFVVLLLLFFIVLIFTQSNTDALTKVKNRRSLRNRMNLYTYLHREYSVIMMDIDNFKSINDTYGHEMGDVVLRGLGKILLEEQHEGFVPYRYGGEEFVLLLNEYNVEKTLYTAEKVRIAMKNLNFEGIDREITISLGVGFNNQDESGGIKQADDNLYYSKHHGKNVVTYSKSGESVFYKS